MYLWMDKNKMFILYETLDLYENISILHFLPDKARE